MTDQLVVNERPTRCPRCGYDLRGVMASWTAQCPLTGQCAECGLAYQWAHVASSKVRRPTWCVEYGLTPFGVAGRCVKTFGMLFWPWGFWRSLRMFDEPRWGRIAIFLLALLISSWFVLSMCNGYFAWTHWHDSARWGYLLPSPVRVVTQAVLAPGSDRSPGQMVMPPNSRGLRTVPYPPPSEILRTSHHAPFINWTVAYFLLGLALCPVGFVALPFSRRQAKIRTEHLVRVTLYGLAMLFVPIAVTYAGVATHPIWPAHVSWLVVPAAVVWWSVATEAHLKMRHPWGIGLATTAMAFLAASVLLVLGFLAASDSG